MSEHRLLILYTGGTIGMVQTPGDTALKPFDFSNILRQMPEISRFRCSIDYHVFEPALDSSDMEPEHWLNIAEVIAQRYHDFDSFVVLHGSDTMAYTASALSFLLMGVNKPVILTGAQLPIGEIRTDAKENLITSIEIATTAPVPVREVCIYFDYQLIRGNRAYKRSVQGFDAFTSYNYPLLAEARTDIQYKTQYYLKPEFDGLNPFTPLSRDVAILKFFPGIQAELVQAVLNTPGLKALLIESYGAGNLPVKIWLFDLLAEARDKNIVVVNITQCDSGRVEMGLYETSRHLAGLGVISGGDMTTEAAITKLMYLCGKYSDPDVIRQQVQENLCGELTVPLTWL